MKRILFLLVLAFSLTQQTSAQCTITGNVTSSSINWSSFASAGCTTIYIGDGVNPTNLTLNGNLDLSAGSTDLGSITFVIRNKANIIFGTPPNNNVILKLKAGSSILIETGGNLDGGNCSNGDRVYIGNILVATCTGNGGSPLYNNFPGLVDDGGYSDTVIASATSICGSGTSTITASKNPAPTATTTFDLYTVPTGGTPIQTQTTTAFPWVVTFTTGTLSADTNYYIEATSQGITTPRKLLQVLVNPVNTWNGIEWSDVLDGTQKLVFESDYSSTGNVSGCTCQVTSGNVVFNAGHTLSIVNDVKVIGGSLTFANDASLVQTNDAAVNSGNINYIRTTRPVTRWAYIYWGSPVQGNVFGQIPSQFDLSYKWQSGTMDGAWLPLSTTNVGEGFITRVRDMAPFNAGTGTVDFTFTGKPNNGVINVNVDSYNNSSMVAGNTVLLANPYPSAIDAAKFLQHPNNTELGGTLFFWTAVTHYSGAGAYNVQDYGSWNLTGGTAPVNDTSLVPNGKIAAGQGFFAQVFTDGTISFNNSMREAGNNNQFFKSSILPSESTDSSDEEIERNRIWLNLSGQNTLRQTLLGYVPGATNDFDILYDGDSFTGNEIDVYTVLNNRKLVIQGRALPFTDTDIVPLGYRVTTAGNYSLSIVDMDGIFAGDQNVYLFDKTTGLYHNLKEGNYTFSTTVGTFNDRFELRYTNQALGTNNPVVADHDIKVVSNNGISVYCASTAIIKVEMYDVLGKLVYSKNGLNTNALEAVQLQSAPQMLLVKVTLDNGQTYTKKTLIQ